MHYDEVIQLPRRFRQLARSELCEVQACQFLDKPVFGIQFHPEKTVTEAEQTFREKRREHDRKRVPLLSPGESHKLYDPRVGQRIFENFLKL
jgi:GMP synthase (glutamine-hydrolysing)